MSEAASTIASVSNTSVKRKRRWVATLLASFALAIVGGGASAWFVVKRGTAAQAARTPEISVAPKYIAHLEGFTVNLADPEETHFLRVTMDLGIDRLPDGVSKDKVTSAMPIARIRDSILRVLTMCQAETLLTADGKAQLKRNLVDSLNKDAPELGIREIYFTEFLVQR
jgi:flagellar FliL protein